MGDLFFVETTSSESVAVTVSGVGNFLGRLLDDGALGREDHARDGSGVDHCPSE